MARQVSFSWGNANFPVKICIYPEYTPNQLNTINFCSRITCTRPKPGWRKTKHPKDPDFNRHPWPRPFLQVFDSFFSGLQTEFLSGNVISSLFECMSASTNLQQNTFSATKTTNQCTTRLLLRSQLHKQAFPNTMLAENFCKLHDTAIRLTSRKQHSVKGP